MSEEREATSVRSTYENIIAGCPWCLHESVFNRVSDLRDVAPIAHKVVTCLAPGCGRQFEIGGDVVNPPHEMLVLDCHELLAAKHHMACLLGLAQAYEVFFGLFMRVEFAFKPYGRDPSHDVDELNGLLAALRAKVEDFTFTRMRSLFLQQVVSPVTLPTMAEAAVAISALPDRPGDPKDAAIAAVPDHELAELLGLLKTTEIHRTRNAVVHKRAYRPSRAEAEAALRETRSILFPLSGRFQLYDDPNWYGNVP